MSRWKKALCAALSLALLTVLCLPCAALEDPNADCVAAVLTEMGSGQVLYGKEENLRVQPASLTKVMTALVAIEAYQEGRVGLDDLVIVSDGVYFDIPADGSNLKFQAGEQVRLEELLYCLVLTSANEVPNIIAEHVSGSVSAFIGEMNTAAAELGCTGTNFANTHGLTNENNYTTARDLARIMQEAMSLPLFATLTATTEHTVPATNLSAERVIKNTNNLIQSGTSYYYEFCKGGKTGYTDAAGYCVVAAAQEGDLSLIAVVMGARSAVASDGRTEVQSFTEARRLFRWAFQNFEIRPVVDTTRLIAEIPVALGNGVQSVVLRPEKEITALLAKDLDLSAVQAVLHVYAQEAGEELVAPIAAGEVLGEAEISLNGVSYGTVRLVANASVALDRTKYMTTEIARTLSNKLVKTALYVLVGILVLYILYVLLYNIRRGQKKRREAELAREKIARLQREETPTTGLTFEEIEKRHAQRRDYYTKSKK